MAAAALLAIAALSAGEAAPLRLDCRAVVQAEIKTWVIRIEGALARPEGERYDRIAASSRPTQFITGTQGLERIVIDVRDGNSGERFEIARSTGIMEYRQLSGLDHSGTEGVVAAATGRCTKRP
jgi:hypothetical protein